MISKLRLAKETVEIFEKLSGSTKLQNFALSKLALALSINSSKKLNDEDFATGTSDLELNRQQIFGDNELIFRALMCFDEKKYLGEDEFFPKYVKAHLDRGAKLLDAEFRYNNKDFFVHLCELGKGI